MAPSGFDFLKSKSGHLMKKFSNEIQVERIIGLLDDGVNVVLTKTSESGTYEVVMVGREVYQLICTWVERGNS